MSIKIMTAVWELELPHAEKLVLLALADNANDEGICWPKVETLVRKCGFSDKSIRRKIQQLEADGHLSVKDRPNKSSLYTIHPGAAKLTGQVDRAKSVGAVNQSERRGQADRSGPVTLTSRILREPSIEPKNPPSPPAGGVRTKAPKPEPPEFAEIREAYPKRSGSHRWDDALRFYLQRRAEGHTHNIILAGVRRYAALMRYEHKLGTEHVLQAATFFGTNRCFLEPYDQPVPRANVAGEAWAKVLEFTRTGEYNKLGATLGPQTDAAVKTMGGYRFLAHYNADKLPFLQGQFASAFNAAEVLKAAVGALNAGTRTATDAGGRDGQQPTDDGGTAGSQPR